MNCVQASNSGRRPQIDCSCCGSQRMRTASQMLFARHRRPTQGSRGLCRAAKLLLPLHPTHQPETCSHLPATAWRCSCRTPQAAIGFWSTLICRPNELGHKQRGGRWQSSRAVRTLHGAASERTRMRSAMRIFLLVQVDETTAPHLAAEIGQLRGPQPSRSWRQVAHRSSTGTPASPAAGPYQGHRYGAGPGEIGGRAFQLTSCTSRALHRVRGMVAASGRRGISHPHRSCGHAQGGDRARLEHHRHLTAGPRQGVMSPRRAGCGPSGEIRGRRSGSAGRSLPATAGAEQARHPGFTVRIDLRGSAARRIPP